MEVSCRLLTASRRRRRLRSPAAAAGSRETTAATHAAAAAVGGTRRALLRCTATFFFLLGFSASSSPRWSLGVVASEGGWKDDNANDKTPAAETLRTLLTGEPAAADDAPAAADDAPAAADDAPAAAAAADDAAAAAAVTAAAAAADGAEEGEQQYDRKDPIQNALLDELKVLREDEERQVAILDHLLNEKRKDWERTTALLGGAAGAGLLGLLASYAGKKQLQPPSRQAPWLNARRVGRTALKGGMTLSSLLLVAGALGVLKYGVTLLALKGEKGKALRKYRADLVKRRSPIEAALAAAKARHDVDTAAAAAAAGGGENVALGEAKEKSEDA